MKKFTLVSLLMLIVCMMAKAQLMDKAFYKMAKFETIQAEDVTPMTATGKGTNPITVKNNKTNNTPRYLFTNWGENAYATCPAELPETGYTFSTEFCITADAGVSNCLELVLAPADVTYKTTHMRLFNSNTYFFRMHQATNAADGLCEIYINGDVENDADWNFGETIGTQAFMKVGVNYSIRVNVSKDGTKASYVIAEVESGEVLSEGDKDITAFENKHIGMLWFNTSGACTYDFNDVKLSTLQEGPFANDPTVEALAVIGTQRAYYAQFEEGEVLHWTQLGDGYDLSGNTYADGEEGVAYYYESNDTRGFEQNSEDYFGSKIIICSASGDLKVWTTREDDETNASDGITIPVVCEEVFMPTPVADITSVQEGYAKEYTITADNSETLLQPLVTIHTVVKDASGSIISEKDIQSGEKISLTDAGSIELYAWDGTHPTEWYSRSENVTVNNNVEYVEQNFTNYAWTKAECEASIPGYTSDVIIETGNSSHWERIYSDQKYGYDESGNAVAWVDGTEYVWVKEGFGFFPGTAITTEDAQWPVQRPDDIYTGFLPLIPVEATNYKDLAWSIFPLEGIVYYNTSPTNVYLNIDPQYVSDDASKPNFYIVHTRGGYDRPDKGDCNATTVCVAGEQYTLYRYDTAICDVRILTYKGFTPTPTGISSAKTAENAAPAIRKIVSDKGIVIVNGDKNFSVSGVQVK